MRLHSFTFEHLRSPHFALETFRTKGAYHAYAIDTLQWWLRQVSDQ